jgi:integrase
MRFTKPAIAALKLPNEKAELIAFDDAMPGFGIRIRAGGKRTWVVQYRVGQRQRRLTLGRVEILDLDHARAAAKQALAKVGLGGDPRLEREKSLAEAAKQLSGVADRYLAVAERRLRPRSFHEMRRYLKVAWAPLGDVPIGAIDRATVASHLARMTTENGPVAADRARASLSALFNWAAGEGIADSNPVAFTNRPSNAGPRNRILTDGEIAEVWRSCGNDEYGQIIRLLILTGQRREEVGGIAWSEIDLDKALWQLPAERTKNGRAHQVPLSDAAIAILSAVPERAERDLVFGAGERGFSGWSWGKASLDHRILDARKKAAPEPAKAKPMPAWTVHDLRRTWATRSADIGTAPHIVEAVLNHLSGAKSGIAGVYNLSVYAPEKRAAMVLWGAHITGLLDEGRKSNVKPLRRA